MFDERSVNLIGNPTVYTREDFGRYKQYFDALIPLIVASVQRFKYEWDKWAQIEIGEDTYVMKPNESGGYSWEKIDYFDHDWYEDESEPEITQGVVNSSPNIEQPESQSAQAPSTTVQAPQTETLNKESLNKESSINTAVQEDEAVEGKDEQRGTGALVQKGKSFSSSPLHKSTSAQVQSVSPAPQHIDSSHWKELVCDSAIDPQIASANFKSLHQHGWQHQAWEYLFYSDDIPRRNGGRLSDGDLKRYNHIDKGGWWCEAGVDPRSFAKLQRGEQPDKKLWGCYKPNEPRYIEAKRKQKALWTWQNKSQTSEKPDRPDELKKVKYEHPPKTNLSIFLLEVPDEIANKVYSKAGVDPSQDERKSGFWYCVWKHNIPITITEGAKKTAAILSQGDAAIGLPGINAGYRATDEQQNPITPHLREEFAVFATPGREIKICFDYETKSKTKKSVFAAIARTGKLLENAEAKVSVVSLPGPEKGIDDLIVAHGAEAYQKVMSDVLPLQEWQQQNPPPDLRFTIFLKDGKEINLYEKQADGTVTSNPANLNSAEIDNLTHKLPENLSVLKVQQNNSDFIEQDKILPKQEEEFTPHTKTNFSKYWAEQRQVPNYVQNLPRSFLLKKENKEIALTAKKLIDQYGLQSDDGNSVYRSEAFSIRKFGDKISIHRAKDEKDSYFSFPLMQFEVDNKNKIKIIKPPFNMLPVEREEFLKIANNLNQGSELPSFYEDATTLKQNLSSLAPLGTQNTINNLQKSEVSQLLTTILETAGSKHLQVGEYRIKSENNQKTGKSFIKLTKKDQNDLERIAVQIDTTTNEAQIMKLSEDDINNLRLIAKKVQLEYSSSNQQQPSSYTSSEYINEYNPNPSANKYFVSTPKPKFQTKEKEHKQSREYMGRAINELMNQYGTTQNDGSRIYHSQAYTFVTNSTSLMVFRRDNNSLEKSKDLIVKIDNYQNEHMSEKIKVWEISPDEKAAFIELAKSLDEGERLPPMNASPAVLKSRLGKLSPDQLSSNPSPPNRQKRPHKSRDIEL